MTETEYLRVTNRVKITAALRLLRDCLPGDLWALDESDYHEACGILIRLEQRLFDSYECEGENDDN